MKACLKYGFLFIIFWVAISMQSPTGPVPVVPRYVRIGSSPLQSWALLYREFRTEFMACLYGRETGDSVTVQWSVLASTKPSQVSDSGVSRPIYCPNLGGTNEMIGIAHSHPSGSCGQSPPDLRTFVDSGLAVSVIVCGPGRLAVYTRGAPTVGVRCIFDAEADTVPLTCLSPTDARPPAGPAGDAGPANSQR